MKPTLGAGRQEATPITWSQCYDFPDVVLHRPDCPRYRGGICRPAPDPRPPANDEQREVVEHYEALKGGEFRLRRVVVPTGRTLGPSADA